MGKPGAKARALKEGSPWLPHEERSRARDQKRDALLKTAAQLFCLEGFHKTTLADIARQLHITKPAIYHYFASKDEILLACVREALTAVEDEFTTASRQGANGCERLVHFMSWYAVNMTTVFGMCLVRIADQDLEPATRGELYAAKTQVDRRIRQLLEQGIEDGSIAGCNARLAAFTIAGALSWIGHWYKPGGRLTPREVAEDVVRLLTSGLNPRPAPAERAKR